MTNQGVNHMNTEDTQKPKKIPNRKRAKSITLRTTDEHFEKFNRLANELDLNKNEIIEKIIDDGFGQTIEITSPVLKELFDKFDTKLKEPFNNLNQIAKHMNSNEVVPASLWKSIEEIEKTYKLLNTYIREQKRYKKIEKNISTGEK